MSGVDIKALLEDARKAQAAVLGIVVQAVALGVLHGQALHIAQVIVSVLTAIGVYLTPNGPTARAMAKIKDTGPGFTGEPDVPGSAADLTWANESTEE